jgi:hypothetical protein
MDKQQTLQTIERELDDIETKLDAAEQVVEIVQENKTFFYVGAAVTLIGVAAASAYAGYKFAQKKLETKYDQHAEEQIAAAKEYYSRYAKADAYETPEKAVEALIPVEERQIEEPDPEAEAKLAAEAVEAVQKYAGGAQPVAYDKVIERDLSSMRVEQDGTVRMEQVQGTVEVVTNVFTDADLSKWDYESEMAKRSHDQPYIITEEEYLQNDPEHDQVSITYYAGDDTLADVQDIVIEDHDRIGVDNLVRFGHGNKNPHLLYVRNEVLELDFEITRSSGEYADEVLDLKHSWNGRDEGVRRFRRHGDDE